MNKNVFKNKIFKITKKKQRVNEINIMRNKQNLEKKQDIMK